MTSPRIIDFYVVETYRTEIHSGLPVTKRSSYSEIVGEALALAKATCEQVGHVVQEDYSCSRCNAEVMPTPP